MNIQEIVPGRPIEAAAGFPYREQRREQSFIWWGIQVKKKITAET